MLFKYAIINSFKCFYNILLIFFWNITNIFINLNYITIGLNNPYYILKKNQQHVTKTLR